MKTGEPQGSHWVAEVLVGHKFINRGHTGPLWPFTSSGVSILPSFLMEWLPEVRYGCLREKEQERREQKLWTLSHVSELLRASVFPSPK